LKGESCFGGAERDLIAVLMVVHMGMVLLLSRTENTSSTTIQKSTTELPPAGPGGRQDRQAAPRLLLIRGPAQDKPLRQRPLHALPHAAARPQGEPRDAAGGGDPQRRRAPPQAGGGDPQGGGGLGAEAAVQAPPVEERQPDGDRGAGGGGLQLDRQERLRQVSGGLESGFRLGLGSGSGLGWVRSWLWCGQQRAVEDSRGRGLINSSSTPPDPNPCFNCYLTINLSAGTTCPSAWACPRSTGRSSASGTWVSGWRVGGKGCVCKEGFISCCGWWVVGGGQMGGGRGVFASIEVASTPI